MGSIKIKGFCLSEIDILRLKRKLDNFFGDDLNICLDFLEGGVKLCTDDELRIKSMVRCKNEN